MKRILGLDLGTNSIGWALVEQDFENKQGGILGMGSRIIPMGQDKLSEFGKGNSVSQTAERTRLRSVRRLRERHLLRRERLHRVLNAMGFLPNHYSAQIDFNKKFGQFLEDKEPKLAFNEKDFIFKNSFQEMLKEFRKNQPELVNRKNRKGETAKIPYDWTIYYLRKKALTQKIEKEELAWLILNFNQKRGYYQLRGEEEEENQSRREFVEILEIINIKKGEADKKNKERFWYTIQFKNGWNYSATFASEPHWLNTKREFLVLEEYDDEGNIKIVKDRNKDVDGIEKRKITPLPTFDEINLLAKKDQDKIYKKIKVRTELTIKESGKTVGSYIYENLLRNPNQKIRGKLVRTIERQFYKEELKAIIKKQIELQPEFFNNDIYNTCIRELYRNNDVYQNFLGNRDFVHLLIEDIIFYQRPLKSKKSLIGNCSLEYYTYKDESGNMQKRYVKAIPKSNPYYQEFRVWQWLYNLKIFKKDDDTEVTGELIKDMDDFELLFEFLMTQKDVDHKAVIKHLLLPKEFKGKALTAEIAKYRWNYVYDSEKDESKKYPMNITGYEIRRKLENVYNVSVDFLNKERELQLWHIIYSVSDPSEFEKALKKFARKNGLDVESFSSEFKNFKPFPSEYGAYSEKAIKKLLPLIRMKKYWNWEDIDLSTQDRIDKIIAAEYDEKIKERVREKTISLAERSHFQGLQLWLAQYVVYGRHSEADVAEKWNTVADLNKFLEGFKQHSLRNPIVEQVITETLRVVGDIWNKFGNGDSNFFNEIHIELGREMKNPSEKREQLTKMIFENENTNLRIKAILTEFLRDDSIENVRPYSPTQQEIFKIYEDGVLNSGIEIPDYVTEIIKKFNETDVSKQPKTSDVNRYKLWLEQKYKSPYTGQPIPLSKLFTSDYEIEHVIPQSRFLDDSISNKVICEAAVNALKGNQLGFEFIKNHYGEKVECGQGRVVAILSEEAYKALVKENYAKNLSKRNKLLMVDVPDKMIERQLNDTRYISKYITNLLSNIVRNDRDDEGINSENLIPGNGKVTSRLKQDWGLNDVWNALILPRFERMNELTKTSEFTSKNKEGHMIPTIPLELSKGFQKKRIDHRHHALDALIIACATREHIQYLNNENAKSQKFHLQHGLAKKLRKMEEKTYFKNKKNEKGIWVKSEEKIKREVPTDFIQPWETFTIDAKNHLEKIVISFKQNLRVINKATNTYEKIENGKKVKKKQEGMNWAIRKPMHEETVSGLINLPRVKLGKGEFTTATRKRLDVSYTTKRISSITDLGIQRILIKYLETFDKSEVQIRKGSIHEVIEARIGLIKDKKLIEHPELAFSPEGIEDMNKNIAKYNNAKFHQPIFNVRIYEKGKGRFVLGEKCNKKTKYVQGSPNLFFAIYENKQTKDRMFDIVPLKEVIEHQKKQVSDNIDKLKRTKIQFKNILELNNKPVEVEYLFHLSPNDLVYIPTKEEIESINKLDFENLTHEQKKRLYNVNDFSSTCYFSPNSFAKAIAPKEVDLSFDEKKNKTTGSFDTKTASLDKLQIKDICVKLKIDRLGYILKA